VDSLRQSYVDSEYGEPEPAAVATLKAKHGIVARSRRGNHRAENDTLIALLDAPAS
jgi:hypothetical protein